MCMLGHAPALRSHLFSDGGRGWSVIRGKFIAINAANMSCACPRSPKGLSPSAHLADGTTDLILVRKCSRLDFFRHLFRHTNKDDQVLKELGLMQVSLSRPVLNLTLDHFTKGISAHVWVCSVDFSRNGKTSAFFE